MKTSLQSLALVTALVIRTSLAFGQEDFIDVRFSVTPAVILIDGKPTSYFELYLKNIAADTLQLKRFLIIEDKTSRVVASFDHGSLKTRVAGIHGAVKGKETRLPPGSISVLYVEVVIEAGQSKTHYVPKLEFDVIEKKRTKSASFTGSFYISTKKPPVLGAPLREGKWAAVYEPSWERGHRRVIYRVDSVRRIPGRFAIDFIKLDDKGKYATSEENEIKNWYGYSADVLAVSDGVVLSARDDFKESSTLSGHPRYSAEEATGNYISLEIGKEQIVFYEHLKPGSIKVKPGQRIKKGDVIASLGFTGQSTGPHLHLHVADKNSPLGAEGIPFVFESFIVIGSYNDMAKFGKETWEQAKNHGDTIKEERPAPNAVIKF